MKFHEHYRSALEEGVDHVREIAYRLATGYDEVLTYQGRVSYKIDQDLQAFGLCGPDAYLKDENGNPVPETVTKCEPSKTEKPDVEFGGGQQNQDVEFDVGDGPEREK